MTIYLASFDIKSVAHDYSFLYDDLKKIDAHQAQASVWMIESEMVLQDLSLHLLAFLHQDDSLLLVEMGPSTHWAATHLTQQTGEWLQKRRP